MFQTKINIRQLNKQHGKVRSKKQRRTLLLDAINQPRRTSSSHKSRSRSRSRTERSKSTSPISKVTKPTKRKRRVRDKSNKRISPVRRRTQRSQSTSPISNVTKPTKRDHRARDKSYIRTSAVQGQKQSHKKPTTPLHDLRHNLRCNLPSVSFEHENDDWLYRSDGRCDGLPSLPLSLRTLTLSPNHNKPQQQQKESVNNDSNQDITVSDPALAMNIILQSTMETKEKELNEKQTDKFKIKMVKINPRGLAKRDSTYKSAGLMEKLKLGKYRLTQTPRGSSKAWSCFYSIIDDNNVLINNWAYCHFCNKVYYKGNAVSNLLNHANNEHENDVSAATTKKDRNIRNNDDGNGDSKEFIPLNNATRQHIRSTAMFSVNLTYTAFQSVSNPHYLNHCQALIAAGAKHGNFDVRGLGLSPFKLKNETKNVAKSIRKTHIEIINKLCQENVLPPISFNADLYGDAYLQRANIGLVMFCTVNFELRMMSLGVIPFDGITKYVIRTEEDDVDGDFTSDDFLDNGDRENPGGYKVIEFTDSEGVVHRVTLPIKNWMNIQHKLNQLMKLYKVRNRASAIFQIVFTIDKGANILKAITDWLIVICLICMAHRLSTASQKAVTFTKDTSNGFSNFHKAVTSLITNVNQSSYRSKMKPSLKSIVPTRFWSEEIAFGSVEPNYEKLKAYAQSSGQSDKMRWHKNTLISYLYPLRDTKTAIKAFETRTSPTIHLLLPTAQRLHNVQYAQNAKDSAYTKIFKRQMQIQLVDKCVKDIHWLHIIGSWLCIVTRDAVFKFNGVSTEIWDGPLRREEAIRDFIAKYKEFKILWLQIRPESDGNNKTKSKSKRKRGRPKGTKATASFDIFSFSSSSQSVSNTVIDTEDEDSDGTDISDIDIEDPEQIPREIQWYINLDRDGAIQKYGERELMQNPLILFRESAKNQKTISSSACAVICLCEVVSWTFTNTLTSCGSECIFNDHGLNLRKNRSMLLQDLATDIHTVQQHARGCVDDLETH